MHSLVRPDITNERHIVAVAVTVIMFTNFMSLNILRLVGLWLVLNDGRSSFDTVFLDAYTYYSIHCTFCIHRDFDMCITTHHCSAAADREVL